MAGQHRAVVTVIGFNRPAAESAMRAGITGGKLASAYWATMRENAALKAENARLSGLVAHYQGLGEARYQRRRARLEGWSMARFAVNWGLRAAALVLVAGGAIGWVIGWIG